MLPLIAAKSASFLSVVLCGWCWLRCLAAAVVVELLGMEVASMTRTQRKRFYRLHKRSVIKQQNEKARLEL
jgi:hypothetical protein